MARHTVLPLFHAGQMRALAAHQKKRLVVVRCGRRFGKTELAKALASLNAIKGRKFGYFAPAYKYISEVFREIKATIKDEIESSNKTDGVIHTYLKGRIDFWSTENENCGRSRNYHTSVIDEAGICKENMMEIWQQAIQPTLLDYNGAAIVFGTPKGVKPGDFFYEICNDKKHGFHEIHLPTHTNPHLSKKALEKLREQNHPLVFKQEFLAEFVDWSGVKFFDLEKMMVNGKPIPFPTNCDSVFAIIDSATKTGKEHDGTAVTYYARSRFVGHPLIALDYDKVQIEGALLESWLPSVFKRLEELSLLCGARMGSVGVWIEDKNSGTILLQQAIRRGWNANPIDSKLTSLGKDERAINISGYVYQGMVKISQHLYDKLITFKQQTRNHWLTEILGFRIGVKDQEDDLLDTFCYGVALALGNKEGY